MSIGERLEETRLKRGETQDEAVTHIHSSKSREAVSQATFSRWAKGQSRPKPEYWTGIARYLGIPRDKVQQLVNDDRARDPEGDRMVRLEERFDGLDSRLDELALAQAQVQRLVDEIARALGPAASPRRRRAR